MYVINHWEWSPDKFTWMNVLQTFVVGGEYNGKELNTENKRIVQELDGKNFIEGRNIL